MVAVSDIRDRVELSSSQIQHVHGPEAVSHNPSIPSPAVNDATQNQSSNDLKVNTATSFVLRSRLNNHSLGQQGITENDEPNTRSNDTASKIIQRRIEKGLSMTHHKAPDRFYRHSQVFPSVDGAFVKKPRKSFSLHLVEFNQKRSTMNTHYNSVNGEKQRGVQQIFFQKEIAPVEAKADQHNSFARPMADHTTTPTMICGSENSPSNKNIGTAIHTTHTSSLPGKKDEKNSVVIADGGVAAMNPTDANNNTPQNNETTGSAKAEPEDSNALAVQHKHMDPLNIKMTRSSQGSFAYRLARQNQTGSATSSSRRKQLIMAPNYSVRHRTALSGLLSSAMRRKPAETTPAAEHAKNETAPTQEPASPQQGPGTEKADTTDALHVALKLNSVPSMSNLVKPDFCKTQHPITTHQLTMSRRSLQPRKTMVVFLCKYPVVRTVGKEMDFGVQESENDLNEFRFNLCWSDTVLSLSRLVRLGNWQRSNHFPSMFLLCQKSHLSTTLGRMKRKLPNYFQFVPNTWSLSTDRCNFQQYFNNLKQCGISRYFIVKPSIGSQGRGIIITNDPLKEVGNTANCVVQEYINSPLLFGGRKFDLRVYVLLMGIREPSIFMFNDGLVRICTEEYEPPAAENSKNSFKHLTNYAINKRSTNYVFNTDVSKGDIGNKRNFRFMNNWLESEGYSVPDFWDRVGSLIVKTIMSAQPKISQVYDACFPGYNEGYNCFEVLGFDVLVDSKLKPWLLEVNHTPSFATDTPLDLDIKSRLLREVLDIVGCKANDHELDRRREREEFTYRNMPPWTKNHLHHSQWSYALNLLQKSEDDENNGGGNTGMISSNIRTINQRQDNNDRSASTLHPVVSHLESDSELYLELVRLHRKKEDSNLVNFKRIYPSSDPEIQNVYDTIRSVAAASLTSSPRTMKNSSPRPNLASQPIKTVPSTSLSTLNPHQLQRSLSDSKKGEGVCHPRLPEGESTPLAIANRTTTTLLDTPAKLQKGMPNSKQTDQPKNSNKQKESSQMSEQPPSQHIERDLSSDAKLTDVKGKCINECNTMDLCHDVAPTDGNSTSAVVGMDSPLVSRPVLPEPDATEKTDEDKPTPTPDLDGSLSSVCLEQELMPNEGASNQIDDAPLIQKVSDVITSQIMASRPLSEEKRPNEHAHPHNNAKKCPSAEQPNCEKPEAYAREQKSSTKESCRLEFLQQRFNASDAKYPNECESFDLSD